jgi:deoxycytidine triphosphate deaminase
MFLSGKSIRELALHLENPLFEENTYDESSLRQASYDLRLGAHFFLIGEDFPGKLSEGSSYLVLHPGQFAFLTTLEIIHLPFNLIGLITLRSTYKRQGLVNISGFHVDPTFRGRLTFAVQNIGPSELRLRYRECTFTIFLAKVDATEPSDIGLPRTPLVDEGI